MGTYPFRAPATTVSALLKQPEVVLRSIADLTIGNENYFSDKIFMRGSADSVRGGGARYQRSGARFLNRHVRERAERTGYERASWVEDILEARVHDYGLGIAITREARRRNAIDTVNRGLVLLSNGVVDFVDSLAIDLFLEDSDIEKIPGADWGTDGQAFADISKAKRAIRAEKKGYRPDTVIIHEDQNFDLVTDEKVLAAQPRESEVNAVLTGDVRSLAGLRQVFVTQDDRLQGKAIVLQSGLVGTIADEELDASEGFRTYAPEIGPPINIRQYEDVETGDTVVEANRVCAMWIAEPGAAKILTGI